MIYGEVLLTYIPWGATSRSCHMRPLLTQLLIKSLTSHMRTLDQTTQEMNLVIVNSPLSSVYKGARTISQPYDNPMIVKLMVSNYEIVGYWQILGALQTSYSVIAFSSLAYRRKIPPQHPFPSSYHGLKHVIPYTQIKLSDYLIRWGPKSERLVR